MARQNKGKKIDRKQKRLSEDEELVQLQSRIDEFDPVADGAALSLFLDLPITAATLRGLKEANFVEMTDIQKKTICMSLKGDDIMGTAKTGSGKTLAFLVPVMEALIRNRITEFDGLAALIISPTRELAVQIFEVLTKIGKYNSFSAGLVTGGKDVQYEKERVARMNILVGTPGRISQHMNETVGMETTNLQVLVLDEADRCLDMGFKKQIDSIVSHLPPTRQTLLFSATQSENVTDLARLSLTNPRKIGVSSDSSMSATPDSLEQFYVRIPLDEKLDVLWSFIKSHLKSKILVFFSSLKQVQYAYETFRTLQPGISLMKLYGRHKQVTRLETTSKFTHAQYACLFATDIVARGLDFPAIDWVVQVDCPEDAGTYVHRAGRCARFGRPGKSLLMLLPSEEEAMLRRLKGNKIEPKYMNIRQKNKKTIRPQLQSLCFKDPKMKNLGQRAFISYYKSVYVQKDKEIFKIDDLPTEKYAESLGLPGAPQIKIKGGESGKDKKNMSKKLLDLEKADAEGEAKEDAKKGVRTKYDRMFERQNQTVLSKEYLNMTGTKIRKDQDTDDSDDDFMAVKRQDHGIAEEDLPDLSVPVSKRQAKKALSKKLSAANHGLPTKLKFDDDGTAHPLYELEGEEDFKSKGDAQTQKAEYVMKETETMNDADVEDKELARAKRQDKKRKRKEIERRVREEELSGSDDDEGGAVVTLGTGDLDQDLESLDDEPEQPASKKSRWFEKSTRKNDLDEGVVELDEPETLEDLEALTSRLINN
ncbi:DEAD-domain-containing protein [Metschnikowia bicuspidata var. bicuspidata NRRL YB-4993]|uniref:ATP-dependent RNA helicase n=1 Tax=Metschnikowia bicuspidata var. bicuspidata NRRL YB-4993 TaxID=869754 RepID=A0A1A0HJJ7_9ASCO|nr:DEAD-domain-containing protein [Metschnikowia bicuspidata var. bicuspidata NRRL YB-4993]OBA24171.1 DEAD-domain-containing protein [Metschnikowia bicuspidata var. bicuspidata NRRL YB-4993]